MICFLIFIFLLFKANNKNSLNFSIIFVSSFSNTFENDSINFCFSSSFSFSLFKKNKILSNKFSDKSSNLFLVKSFDIE